ncbi:hypothetical protein C478_02677 [Natrinema thermotolerans DSM 11552]|nr:hypothetical protein C478_02677 [Natrinema thermotolerans DSM 11552]
MRCCSWVRGISQNKLAARLGQSPALTKSFQFDITDLSNTPTQQDLSYTHGKFSEDTQEVLNRTVAGVQQAALDHGVITEGLVPTGPTELEEENSKSENEYKKEKVQKTLAGTASTDSRIDASESSGNVPDLVCVRRSLNQVTSSATTIFALENKISHTEWSGRLAAMGCYLKRVVVFSCSVQSMS